MSQPPQRRSPRRCRRRRLHQYTVDCGVFFPIPHNVNDRLPPRRVRIDASSSHAAVLTRAVVFVSSSYTVRGPTHPRRRRRLLLRVLVYCCVSSWEGGRRTGSASRRSSSWSSATSLGAPTSGPSPTRPDAMSSSSWKRRPTTPQRYHTFNCNRRWYCSGSGAAGDGCVRRHDPIGWGCSNRRLSLLMTPIHQRDCQ